MISLYQNKTWYCQKNSTMDFKINLRDITREIKVGALSFTDLVDHDVFLGSVLDLKD